MNSKNKFKMDWVLINEIAIGPAPAINKDLDILEDNGIKLIFSLCSEKEKPMATEAKNRFELFRNVLPDHTYNRLPQISEIINILDQITNLSKFGPIYIHCFAGIERSPIICMAWLIRENSLNFNDALEYLRQVHPETNPLPEQLMLLKDNIINLRNSK
tara:strand:+ start:4001 stop:4477 length:477 start_codon:yes stop_codon:yes gene_type:complete